ALGRAAAEAAGRSGEGEPVAEGNVGAGAGAVVGGLKGGVGSASTVLESGITVGALAVVNAVGSAVDPITGVLYGRYFDGRPDHPSQEAHAAARRRLAEAVRISGERRAGSARPPLNTTLAVVATDAALSRAQARKLAGTAHDGLARAIRPVHLMSDGDTVFALATGALPLPQDEVADPAFAAVSATAAFNDVLAAGADTVMRAIVRAVLAAEGVDGPGGLFPAYRDLYPNLARHA
ncbi:P1 family peptidase, partial [Streptomyces sp. GC420]|uniref:P1 family peptidase n=1 Tax=Streptomyces sp. GC420 TaxID=2697568 RepID=UPI0014150B5F